MSKPSIPQGTRDFGPDTVRKRNFILNTIKNVFQLYGFQPLETPAMENLETLMGKYGDEGDKLIFKILNNGLEHPSKREQARKDFEKILEGKNFSGITERALKYDLTIPFARYVAMNHNQLTFPFKRYQIQPVWRADRPQKGRYREFFQCDADVVGSDSLLNEIELINMYHDAFVQLGIRNYELRINHRKIITGLAELCGGADKMNDVAIVIDKLDKIGLEKVKEELQQRGLNKNQVGIVEQYLSVSGDSHNKLSEAKKIFTDNETAKKGIEDLEFILNSGFNTQDVRLSIDFTLARGLNYYTGIIFEANAPVEVKFGSIGGGGRYDDLTGLFSVPGIAGTGISFGLDRIYDVMEELNLFPAEVHVGTKVLFFNLGEKESKKAFELMQRLRKNNISCELYHEAVRFDKQFKYAEKKNIPFVIILGEEELKNQACTIKNINTGKQQTISQKDIETFSF